MSIDAKTLNFFERQVSRSQEIIVEIRAIKAMKDPLENDIARLVELRSELSKLCPPSRFAWCDARPVIDLSRAFLEAEEVGHG